jgi:hypothetical protein
VVMLRLLSRGLLTAVLCLGSVALRTRPAFAEDEEFDDEGGDEEGGGKGDEDSEEGEDDDPDAKDQPPVTAGGLFTLATYPVREISRPLTMTQHITQLRASIGTDISAKGAFETGGLSLEAIHGYKDNFSIIGGFTNAYNMRQYSAYVGFEASLAYDLVDFRLSANVHRNAIPNYQNFCSPLATNDPVDDPRNGMPLVNPMSCAVPDAAIVNLPNGAYNAGDTQVSIDIGFPFRYAIKPEIAIVALQTLMSIDFNGVDRDHVISVPRTEIDPVSGDAFMVTRNIAAPNGAKPDLKPSIGIATNPIAPLSVVIFAQLRIPDFDTSAGAFQVPVTGRIEFTPNQKFDVGLEFTLLNVKPPEGQSPIDNRFIALFAQSRFGK